jgi:hypothetical protein
MTTSLLTTNLSVSPYFDDFDQTANYYKVLYKPATAIQVRELNTAQSIMQDQIDKFGRSVYQEGSVVEGCAFTFDNSYAYVKINDNFVNSTAISSTSQFIGNILVNQSNLTAIIVNSIDGLQSSSSGDLNTFYIKYLNTANFTDDNGYTQSVYTSSDILQIKSTSGINLGNVVVATVSSAAGLAYAVSVTEGVIFKKGFFLRVPQQTLVVGKYNNSPDGVSIGFNVQESIISSSSDTTLFDNAAGSPNYNAPGADRLKLVPSLTSVSTSTITNSSSFFSLIDFKNGLPVTLKTNPQYTSLSKELARRTYETNGNYVVNPFILSVTNKSAADTHTYANGYVLAAANSQFLNLVSSSGIAYVQGYRVEFINNNNVDLRRGNDLATAVNQQVTINMGYWVNTKEYCGDFGNFTGATVEIHSIAKQAITTRNFLSVGYSTSTKIGTAYCRGLAYSSGTPGADARYRFYLSNIQMLPGFNFSQALSFIRYSSGVVAVADIVQTINSSGTYSTLIQDPFNETMIHPFGQKAVYSGGFGSGTLQNIYRNKLGSPSSACAQFSNSTGSARMTFSLSSPSSFYYLNNPGSFNVIPGVNMFSGSSVSATSKTGTVSIYSVNTYVSGSSTTFTSDYAIGDYIYVSSTIRRIVSITSSIAMNVDAPFNGAVSAQPHLKVYPAGVPINFANSTTKTITITGGNQSANLNLGEYITASVNCTAYYDTLTTGLNSAQKIINRNTYIVIQPSTHPNGVNGPWSLGIPDVLNINHVYVGTSIAVTNPDQVSSFTLDNGQRDSYYELASISSASPVANNVYLLVSVDNFTIDAAAGGYGFFTANSYPIDDTSATITNKIRTAQIPQYVSINTKTTTDLRDSIDHRPYSVNTAVVSTTTGGATINPSATTTLYNYGVTISAALPSPDSPFQAGQIQYYLPRVDRIALTTGGNMIITEGIASVNPFAPPENAGTMTIGLVNVPAYPTLTPTDASSYARYDYAVQTTIQQTKRYTMADIKKLDNRITQMEYYTSLNLLEQSASSLLIRSSTTGQNRFQNGILVDSFKDFTIGNTNDPNFNIALDSARGEARPYFSQYRIPMYFDSTQATNAYGPTAINGNKYNQIIALANSAAATITQTQQFATSYRNCLTGNFYNWSGSVTLYPSGTVDPDITKGPDIVSNLDLSQNWVNIAKAWGTVWGGWTNIGAASTAQDTVSSQTTNPDGSLSPSYQTQTTTTTTQQTQQIGQQISVTPSSSTVNLGNYVTNVSILPYIKSTPVLFTAHGLKPNTKLYTFFNSVPVSNCCIPLTPYTGTTQTIGGILVSSGATPLPIFTDINGNMYTYTPGAWGNVSQGLNNLVSTSTGDVYGVFLIPDSTFKAGQLQFLVTDIFGLTQGINASTTAASATYYASTLSIQQSSASLQVQNPQIAQQDVTNNKAVQQVSVTTTNYTAPTPSTPAYIPREINYPADMVDQCVGVDTNSNNG